MSAAMFGISRAIHNAALGVTADVRLTSQDCRDLLEYLRTLEERAHPVRTVNNPDRYLTPDVTGVPDNQAYATWQPL